MKTLQSILSATAIATFAFLAAPGAMAQDADYTPDDVVNAIKEGAKAAKKDGPKTRAVTFGPAGFGDKDEAKPEGAATAAAEAPAAFNLMVTFGYNSDALTGQAERNLRNFAEALNRPELSSMTFAVDGHTDASGAETYNQSLSERRAASVVRYLTAQGVAPERLVARGFGETRPADTADPAANRRVEARPIE